MSSAGTPDVVRQNLFKYRKANGLTQSDLAARLHVTKQSVSAWETGQNEISVEILALCCQYLGVSLDDMCGMKLGDRERITPEELEVLLAYRRHKEMQPAVRVLLGLDKPERID